jgi:ribonuclease HI
MWTLFFDGSKSLEGAGVGCILKDPNGKKTLISCRLEFQCTNNIVEYEALLQGLKKEVDMKARKLKVFGDYEIVINTGKKHHKFPFKSPQTLPTRGMGID